MRHSIHDLTKNELLDTMKVENSDQVRPYSELNLARSKL